LKTGDKHDPLGVQPQVNGLLKIDAMLGFVAAALVWVILKSHRGILMV
jgi:hypothetical protein